MFPKLLRGVLTITLLSLSLVSVRPVRAGGVVGTGAGTCTEMLFDQALMSGGTVTFDCGGPATITLTSPKTITENTIINGGDQITLDGSGNTRLFVVNADATLTLNGVTLQGGKSGSADGGAILNHGTLILNHAFLHDNVAGSSKCGGAISSDGQVTISATRFYSNTAGSGGAICTSSMDVVPTLEITDSRFEQNTTYPNPLTSLGYGGAIQLGLTQQDSHARLKATNVSFTGNTAEYGGALAVLRNATATVRWVPTLETPSAFAVNAAMDKGGAIYNWQGSLNVYDTLFSTNATLTTTVTGLNGVGGGIYNEGNLTLQNSSFVDNRAQEGGGLAVSNSYARANIQDIYFYLNQANYGYGGGISASSGTLTVTHTTFDSNKSPTTNYAGGGLYCGGCNLQLSNSSFVHNEADKGAGLYILFDGQVQAQNVTFSDNRTSSPSGLGGAVYNHNGNVDLYFTSVVNNTGGSYARDGGITRFRSTVLHNPGSYNCGGNGTQNNHGNNYISDDTCISIPKTGNDPQLSTLLTDGAGTIWATHYHLPLDGSPLINTGYTPCPTFDQRGAARPDACDIGAVEFGGRLLTQHLYLPLTRR